MQARGANEDTVGGKNLASFNVQHVADHDVVDGDLLNPATAQNGNIALRFALIELFKLVVLLPIGGGAGKDDDENGNDDSDTIYPLNVGVFALGVDRLVDANGEGDAGRNGQQYEELVVESNPHEPEEGFLGSSRQSVRAIDATAVDKVLVGLVSYSQREAGAGRPGRQDLFDDGIAFFSGGGDGFVKGDSARQLGLVGAESGRNVGAQAAGETVDATKDVEGGEAAVGQEFVELRGGKGKRAAVRAGLLVEDVSQDVVKRGRCGGRVGVGRGEWLMARGLAWDRRDFVHGDDNDAALGAASGVANR